MRSSLARLRLARGTTLTLTLAAALAACRDQGGARPTDAGAQADGGAALDGGAAPDGGAALDGGAAPDGGPVTMGCNNPPIPATAGGTCTVTRGSDALLVRGNIITAGGMLENGQLLIAGSGADKGKILCAACDCSTDPAASGATVIACADGLVSPGLINAHDHITFTEAPPAPHSERYVHRHQWRKGQDGLPQIPSSSNQGGDKGIWWGELRNLMAGGTSINGSGGAAGLLRNLDQPAELQEGLARPRVKYSTFPLRDTGGQRLASGCNYGSSPNLDKPSDPTISGASAYTPHIAEGIDDTARNEFVCLSEDSSPSNPDQDVIFNKTAIIHGIGLLAADYANMAADHASLVWSPRSNIDLYGNTAQVVLAKRSGVRIALGSDWAISGSMNMVRELRCADALNARNFGGFFSDRQLVDMATSDAAGALGMGDLIGTLAVGRYADVAIWNGATHAGYRAIIDAEPQDVVLVLRGGSALYGDQAVMQALPDTAADCETIAVCGADKLLCAARETGATTAQMKAAVASNAYDLFFCGAPPNEPSCIPFRPGMTGYSGMPMTGDMDGDGVADAMDDCPSVFNPARPLDGMAQPDADGDGDGDACDPCPLQANSTVCAPPSPDDRDGDGVLDAMDNCPSNANPGQENRDSDAQGDACDPCPDEATVGAQGCSATIYQVRQGQATGRVRVTNGLVTAVAGNGFFMQTVSGDASWDLGLQEKYSGVFVYVGSTGTKPAAGDRVDVDGEAKDYFGEKELDASTASAGAVTVRSSSHPLPDFVRATPAEVGTDATGTHGARAVELEGVLVEVVNVTVTDTNPPRGQETGTNPTNEFVVDGALRVNDYMYLTTPFPTNGDTMAFVRGVLRFSWENYKLEPRAEADVGTEERLARIEPATPLVAAGTSGVPAGGLAVVMNRPVSAPVIVALSVTAGSGVSAPATVTVAAGTARADVPLTVSAMARGVATLSATYDGVTVTADLTLYDDAAARRVAELVLDSTTLVPSSMTSGAVTLDLPGRLGAGSTVALAVTPAGLATPTPASLVIGAGDTRASFGLAVGTSTGAGTLSATVDGITVSLPFTVAVPASRSPAPGDLVITELFRNPSASSEAGFEWFEVYNPTASDIVLAGLGVSDLNHQYVVPATAPNVPAGGYAIFASLGDSMMNGGLPPVAVAYGDAVISLNNSGDTLTLAFGGMNIDQLVYTSAWPGGASNVAACLRAPYAADNGVPTAWSNAATPFGTVTGALGSPGVANDATNCP